MALMGDMPNMTWDIMSFTSGQSVPFSISVFDSKKSIIALIHHTCHDRSFYIFICETGQIMEVKAKIRDIA